MDYGTFDFGQFVHALVVASIEHSGEVHDVIAIAAEQQVEGLVDQKVEDLNLVDRTEFDELGDRVISLEEDMDTSDEAVQDLEGRVDALEKEYVPEEDFITLEQDFLNLEKLFKRYQPLLEALGRIEPFLRMLGLVHAEMGEPQHYYQQHPRYPYHHVDEPRPIRANWQN